MPPLSEFELSDLTGAQTKPGQKQKHGSIPQLKGVAGTGANHPLDIVCGEKPGNWWELPRGETGNRVFHTRRASTGHTEEADESADRDDDTLGTLDPVGACSIEDEPAQSFGWIGACVISKGIEKPHKDSLINVECGLSQSTVVAHPRTEFSQDGPLFNGGRWDYRRRKFALLLEESDK
jgi:hypothetical protein